MDNNELFCTTRYVLCALMTAIVYVLTSRNTRSRFIDIARCTLYASLQIVYRDVLTLNLQVE